MFVQLANEFAALGYQVDLALASARGPYLEEISTDVRVIDFRAGGVLRSIPKLARYLRVERPDVLLSGLDHANIMAILARFVSGTRTRCIVSVRAVPTAVYRDDKSIGRWVLLWLSAFMFRFSYRIIANSQSAFHDLSQSLRIPERKISIIYNPLDMDRIKKLSQDTADHPLLNPVAQSMVLGAGSLDVRKDFPTLIRAFAVVRSIRDCRLVILGEGPEREELETLIRQMGLQDDVYLPGFVINPFVWMRRSAVFVCSSLNEGCPNVLMQALACGTPVISTDCPGASTEILEGGKWGQLVSIGDPAAMADAILNVLQSDNHPDVQQRAKDFAPDEIVRQFLSVLLPQRSPVAQEN